MSEHEVSRVLSTPAEEVFALAADLQRLPEWLPTVREARATTDGGPQVHLEGDTHHGHYASEGFWRPSPEQRRVEWGSQSRGAPATYAGWLQVSDSAAGSEITVHLSFLDDTAEPPDVDGELGQSLAALAALVEG